MSNRIPSNLEREANRRFLCGAALLAMAVALLIIGTIAVLA